MYKIRLFSLIFASTILGGLIFLMPYLTKWLTSAAMNHETRDFITLVIVISSIAIARIALRFITSYWGRRMGMEIEIKMRRDAYAKMYRLKQEYFDVNAPGSLIAKIVRDPQTVYYVSFSIISEFIFALLGFAGGISFAFLNSWVVGVAIIIIYILGVFWTYFNATKMIKIQYTAKAIYSKMNAVTTDQAAAISEIKSYNAYLHEKANNEKLNERFRKNKGEVVFMQSGFNASVLGVALLIQIGVLLVAGFELYYGSIGMATFSAFIALSTILIMPMNRIAGLINTFSDGMSSLRRFDEFMSLPEEKWLSKDFLPGVGEIEFKNVTFSYFVDGEKKDVLKDFNLKVKKGQSIALVGESGIGKSTILKLILGFYEIQKGQILVDGQDINKVNINSVRENVSYIQQHGIIFDGSLKDNIKYKNIDTTDEEVLKVIKSSKLSKLVNSNEDGINMKVGTNGSQLSGGQKQRVSIARAMVAANNIVLLDEATSALDNNTEKDIQDSINTLFKGKTTITVAHRISTIVNSDVIYYIEKGGKISEKGTYKELIKKKGKFYKLTLL